MKVNERRQWRRYACEQTYPIAELFLGAWLKWQDFKLNVSGIEDLPYRKPCVVVPRHQDYSDVPLLWYAFRQRPEILPTWIMGDFSGNGIVKKITPLFGAIKIYRPPIDFPKLREGDIDEALRVSRETSDEFYHGLSKGDCFVNFAQGSIYVGDVDNFRTGFFSRACRFEEDNGNHLRVAHVPVGMEYYLEDGTSANLISSNNYRGKLSAAVKEVGGKIDSLDVRFGEPLYRGADEEVRDFMERVRADVKRLSGL